MPKLKKESFDHPMPFLLAVTLFVVSASALIGMGFAKLGWAGPAAVFGQSAS